MRKIGKSTNTQLREHQLSIMAGILDLASTKDEILAILLTVMTPSERQAIAQRTAITYKIQSGQTYADIESLYGVSPTTIAKATDQYLKHGDKNKLFNKIIGKFKEPKFEYKGPADYKVPKERIINTSLSQAYKEFNYKP